MPLYATFDHLTTHCRIAPLSLPNKKIRSLSLSLYSSLCQKFIENKTTVYYLYENWLAGKKIAEEKKVVEQQLVENFYTSLCVLCAVLCLFVCYFFIIIFIFTIWNLVLNVRRQWDDDDDGRIRTTSPTRAPSNNLLINKKIFFFSKIFCWLFVEPGFLFCCLIWIDFCFAVENVFDTKPLFFFMLEFSDLVWSLGALQEGNYRFYLSIHRGFKKMIYLWKSRRSRVRIRFDYAVEAFLWMISLLIS